MLDPYLSVLCTLHIFGSQPENIEWRIEGQAFSQWHNLVPLPHPLPSVSSTGDTEKTRPLPYGRGGGGGGGGAKSRDSKKAWSSISHATLSDLNCPPPTQHPPISPDHKLFSVEQGVLKSRYFEHVIVHPMTPRIKGS
jgi:hypothetical protein